MILPLLKSSSFVERRVYNISIALESESLDNVKNTAPDTKFSSPPKPSLDIGVTNEFASKMTKLLYVRTSL